MRSVSRYCSRALSQRAKCILLVIEKAYSSLWQEMTRAVRSDWVEKNDSLLIFNQPPITVYQQESRSEMSFLQLELSASSHISLGALYLINSSWYLVPLEQFIYLICLLLLMIQGFLKWETNIKKSSHILCVCLKFQAKLKLFSFTFFKKFTKFISLYRLVQSVMNFES